MNENKNIKNTINKFSFEESRREWCNIGFLKYKTGLKQQIKNKIAKKYGANI